MRTPCLGYRKSTLCFLLLVGSFLAGPSEGQVLWGVYAGNAQHTAISAVASQSLDGIIWQTPVDLQPQYSGNDLLIHYGSPLITQANTILVPVKTGATDGFRVEARNGSNGSLLWSFNSDYSLPAHNWTPSYSPTLAPNGRIYMAGAGGTVYYRDSVDSAVNIAPTQLAFYGNSSYNANKSSFNNDIQICTPLTSDANGNVYFGYRASGANPLNIRNGIARIGADGSTNFISVPAATSGHSTQVLMNCAPALSSDGKTLYIVTTGGGNFSTGFLMGLDSVTLAPKAQIRLRDPRGGDAILPEDGTASPTVGPNGNVFIGVLENPFATSKGWLLQFNANLSQTKTPGAFGWDDTASIVPTSMVPSYHGTSTYLIMTKYNNYAGLGGDGVNKLAILDPNDTQIDVRTGAVVMKEVLTIQGVTPDPEFIATHPNAVREWCINTAVVDPLTDSILANSEDGKLYRWNLATNTFTEVVTLTSGIGEAYTPTLIGADGKVYAINNGTLFAVGSFVPEPGIVAFALTGGAAFLLTLSRKRIRRF